MLGEIWIPPRGASSLAFQLTSSCSLKGHGNLPLCHSCSTNLSAHHLLSEPIPCLCLHPMPISEPLFWSLSLCFSLYVSCVCCPLCLSSHLVLSPSLSLPLSLLSISGSCLFLLCSLCPCGSVPIAQSLCVSPCVSISVYISPALAVCLSSSFQTLASLPSLCLSLCVPVLVQTPAPGCHASLA